MKSRKLTPVLAGILLAALVAAGCAMPEYMMYFDIIGDATQGGTDADVIVNYEMENVGRDTLTNAQIVITVQTDISTYSTVVNAGNLNVGEYHSGFASISVSGDYVASSARITRAGWDVDSD